MADGTRAVAVKVLRPGVERRFELDLDSFTFAARAAELMSAEARRLRLVEVVDTLRRSVALEMDLRFEAAALSEMAENTRNDPDFRVPMVNWDRTARDVLTLEWIEAVPLSDRARLERNGLDLKRLACAVIQSFLRHALRDGFFHADMHPGNLFADAGGALVAVDFGSWDDSQPKSVASWRKSCSASSPATICGRLRCISRRLCAAAPFNRELCAGDPGDRRAHSQSHGRRNLDGEAVHAAVRDNRLVRHAHPAGAFAVAEDMVVVEGVARSLDPKLDMWAVAEPVVREWMERHLGPPGRLHQAAQGAVEVGRFLSEVPELLTRGAVLVARLDAITQKGLLLAPETVQAMGRAEARAESMECGGALGDSGASGMHAVGLSH